MPDALPGLRAGAVFLPYRYIALVALMVQTSAVILTMRFSLTTSSYLKTTAVVMSELFKLVVRRTRPAPHARAWPRL